MAIDFENLQPGMVIASRYSGEKRTIFHVGITIVEVEYVDEDGKKHQYVIPRHVLERQWELAEG